MFSSEIFKSIFVTENLRATASTKINLRNTCAGNFQKFLGREAVINK